MGQAREPPSVATEDLGKNRQEIRQAMVGVSSGSVFNSKLRKFTSFSAVIWSNESIFRRGSCCDLAWESAQAVVVAVPSAPPPYPFSWQVTTQTSHLQEWPPPSPEEWKPPIVDAYVGCTPLMRVGTTACWELMSSVPGRVSGTRRSFVMLI